MLLFDAAPVIPAPVAYMAEQLKGAAARDVELFSIIAQRAKQKGRRDVEVACFEKIKSLGEFDARLAEPYAEALRACGRARDGLLVLMNEASAGRSTIRAPAFPMLLFSA